MGKNVTRNSEGLNFFESRCRIPLHRRLAEALRTEISERYQPGDKLEPQNSLAKRLNVSLMTVREAIGILVEEGLVERRHGSGTYVGDRTVGQVVAVLMELDMAHPRTSYYFTHAAQMLRLMIAEEGLQVRLYSGHLKPGEKGTGQTTCTEFLKDLHEDRIRAVVAPAGLPGAQLFEELKRRDISVVANEGWAPNRVLADRKELVAEGVDFLVRSGRTRLALMSWGQPDVKSFYESLKQHAIDVRDEWVRSEMEPTMVGAGWEEFREIWLAHDQKPDGILVTDDMLFADAKTAILQLGIEVPADLVVVSHANRGAGMHDPFPVARLELDPDAYAAAMFNKLKRTLAGHQDDETSWTHAHLIVPPELTEAESCLKYTTIDPAPAK